MRIVSYSNVAEDSLPICEAVRNANFEPIVQAFDVQAFKTVADSVGTDTTAVVIEVGDFYTSDVPVLGLSRFTRERYKVRSLDRDRSFVDWIKSFPRTSRHAWS